MADRLKDKVALVLGAGSVGPGWGNGKATAVLFAREGARVVAADINPAAAAETQGLIEAEGGVCATATGDVSRSADVQALVQRALDTFGRIDVLHNNVGILTVGGAVELSEDDWDRQFAVNIKSMFLTCKFALPHMERQGSGSIINISSTAAVRWYGVSYIAYAASKAAVGGITRTVALQYAAKGIRCNSILPGLMNTPLVHASLARAYAGGDIDEMVRIRDRQSPTGKMGTAWDVAYAALYLASDESRYVNGVELLVDGGFTVKAG
ncbi:MAG: SDR family oxidoreductase [Alphaproteobacteria bacterium]|nr:SDR family oxidoreductase [Alphaproteobacteria bacterium]